MILIQLIKAALVVNTDLKERQILNGSNWTGLNSTPSRCTWEAPWTQNKLQKAPKPGRTFSLIRRTSIVHRCFLDNSAKKTTQTSEQSMESIQDTSLPLHFCSTNFQLEEITQRRKSCLQIQYEKTRVTLLPLPASPASPVMLPQHCG